MAAAQRRGRRSAASGGVAWGSRDQLAWVSSLGVPSECHACTCYSSLRPHLYPYRHSHNACPRWVDRLQSPNSRPAQQRWLCRHECAGIAAHHRQVAWGASRVSGSSLGASARRMGSSGTQAAAPLLESRTRGVQQQGRCMLTSARHATGCSGTDGQRVGASLQLRRSYGSGSKAGTACWPQGKQRSANLALSGRRWPGGTSPAAPAAPAAEQLRLAMLQGSIGNYNLLRFLSLTAGLLLDPPRSARVDGRLLAGDAASLAVVLWSGSPEQHIASTMAATAAACLHAAIVGRRLWQRSELSQACMLTNEFL